MMLINKNFEFTNHLGNVLAVATDKRLYQKDTTINMDTFVLWNPYLSTANDYYPFGMLIPSRIYADTALTRQMVYNVTSYEKTTHRQDFTHSTEGYVSTNGADTATVSGRMAITTSAVNESVQFDYPTTPGKQYTFYILADPGQSDSFYLRVQRLDPQALIYDHLMTAGLNEFTFTAQGTSTRLRPRRTDHTNQGAMTSYIDRIILKETRDTLYQDTIQMATGEGYKFGFNGMEQENDWNGLGNSYDFGARIYDARGGRWLSVDPLFKKQPGWSTYKFAFNNPLIFNDINGETERKYEIIINSRTGEISIKLTTSNKVMTDGIEHNAGNYNYNNYFDYSSFEVYTMDDKGVKTQIDNFNIMDKSSVIQTEYIWFEGDRHGDVKREKSAIWDVLGSFEYIEKGGIHIWGTETDNHYDVTTSGDPWGELEIGKLLETFDLISLSTTSRNEHNLDLYDATASSEDKIVQLAHKTHDYVSRIDEVVEISKKKTTSTSSKSKGKGNTHYSNSVDMKTDSVLNSQGKRIK